MRAKTKKDKAPGWLAGLRVRRGDDRPLFVQIREGIRRAIVEGELQPGEALMPQRQLCRTLKINQVTATQAVGDLLREGLLRSEHGRGIFVNDLAPRTVLIVSGTSQKSMESKNIYGVMVDAAIERFARANLRYKVITREKVPARLRFGPPLEEVFAHEAHAYLTAGIQNEEYLKALADRGKPVVALDATPTSVAFDGVTFDSFREGYLCARRLLEAGHREIVFIGQDRGVHPGDPAGRIRIPEPDHVRQAAGARYALQQAGVEAGPERFLDHHPPEGSEAEQAFERLLRERGVTAAIALSHSIEWLERRFKIPRELSLMVPGTGERLGRKFSGTRVDIAAMGIAGARRVIQRLNPPNGGDEEFDVGEGTVITLPAVLIDGQSVREIGPPPEIYRYVEDFSAQLAEAE